VLSSDGDAGHSRDDDGEYAHDYQVSGAGAFIELPFRAYAK